LKVKYFSNIPVLDLGEIGSFDDSGANVSSIVKKDDNIYMYYIGWNPSITVPSRNSIGLAVSYDGGESFEKKFEGPILDRNKVEPYFTAAVDVIKMNNNWKMYYTSGTEWKIVDGKPEIKYHIKYASSNNGVDWVRNDVDCILPSFDNEVVARPSVIFHNDKFKMWYSRRNIDGFRKNRNKSYRSGYAESKDGVNWIRKDEKSKIKPSNKNWEWDYKMIAYPYVINVKDVFLLFYNGNNFGENGFGYAILN
jgi:predicted GH43/DUF377 family glycosyl hydrolase